MPRNALGLTALAIAVLLAAPASAQDINGYDNGYNAGYDGDALPLNPSDSYRQGYYDGQWDGDDDYEAHENLMRQYDQSENTDGTTSPTNPDDQ